MFDFGFAELILIIAISVLVIGPNEIPGLMRSLGRIVRRLQYMRYSLTRQFDDFMEDTELQDIQLEASKRQTGDTTTEVDFDDKQADEMSSDENTQAAGDK